MEHPLIVHNNKQYLQMNIKKPSLTYNNQYHQNTQQYSSRRSIIFKNRPSTIRPQSYQRPSSYTSQKKIYPTDKPSFIRHQTDKNITNQYYNCLNDSKQQRMRSFRSPVKNTSIKTITIEDNDSLKKAMMQQIHKQIIKLSSEIQNQSGMIMSLQKKIQRQSYQIQQKNNIIRTLIYKMQFVGKKQQNNHIFQIKKIQDVQHKLKIIIDQIEEQKNYTQNKIECLTTKVIKHFGNVLSKLKKQFSISMNNKLKLVDNLQQKCEKITNWQVIKSQQINKIIDKIKTQIKISQDVNQKSSCSYFNSSKDTMSNISSVHSNSNKKNQDLFLSDYFFHPKDQDKSNIKIMQQLLKQRKKLNQLPIRVYLDSFGRLKYFQSRTFIFDRKGNFTTPSIAQISIMEQKGWIKNVSQ